MGKQTSTLHGLLYQDIASYTLYAHTLSYSSVALPIVIKSNRSRQISSSTYTILYSYAHADSRENLRRREFYKIN